ncbi:hypothetical protein GOBAR_DD18151 [Gossypium barbadense]|nr:hypothetical protein GOBAR_DD18151 [Gossypium barbadense]
MEYFNKLNMNICQQFVSCVVSTIINEDGKEAVSEELTEVNNKGIRVMNGARVSGGDQVSSLGRRKSGQVVIGVQWSRNGGVSSKDGSQDKRGSLFMGESGSNSKA